MSEPSLVSFDDLQKNHSMKAHPTSFSWLCIALPLILFSSNAVLSKFLMTDGCSAMEVLFYRSFGAVLFGLLFIRHRFSPTPRMLLSIPGLLMVANIVCYNIALKYISGYMVMVLESTCFLFSLLFSLLCREKIRIPWYSLLLMLPGFGLLFHHALSQTEGHVLAGLFWGLMTSATFGLFNSTIIHAPKDIPRLYALMLPSLIVSTPFTLWKWSQSGIPAPGAALLLIAVLGIVITGLPYDLWGRAAGIYSGMRLSQLFLLTLPGTFLMERIFLGSSVSLPELIASLLLIASIFLNTSGQQAQNSSVRR